MGLSYSEAFKMQARNTLLTFILVVSALAGLASAAPLPSADIAASTPATHEKEATPGSLRIDGKCS
ncbi:hypothetical protein PSTT_01593 [Puccinia striiformis]|uniref:Uncharacterized protein n=1 Tax=Puccinia striiformis TaxID=27350 RepID=A0A2S4W2Z7_9BASI|nr:hypothetical protein PSTT_01593 [Puccinia striiformis]